jgi:hypothetical protein
VTHSPKVAGSNPAPATKHDQLRGPFRDIERDSLLPACPTICQRPRWCRQSLANGHSNGQTCGVVVEGLNDGCRGRRVVDRTDRDERRRTPMRVSATGSMSALLPSMAETRRSPCRRSAPLDGEAAVRRAVASGDDGEHVAHISEAASRAHRLPLSKLHPHALRPLCGERRLKCRGRYGLSEQAFGRAAKLRRHVLGARSVRRAPSTHRTDRQLFRPRDCSDMRADPPVL